MSKKENTGACNTGHRNSGDRNTGHYNTGHRNSGDRNTGHYNTGDYNTGDRNTGNCNSGEYNTGYRNTGDCNSGDRNTGHYNTGDYNTGDYNSGNRNTGDYNTGHRNSGDCNTDRPRVRLFNKESSWEFYSDIHVIFRRIIRTYSKPLCEWVSELNMSDKEKEENETYKTTGGYLKVNKERFNGKDISKEDEKFLRAVPNFDAEILLECTGIDLINKKKKIVINGKEILISKESFEEMKRQFCESK